MEFLYDQINFDDKMVSYYDELPLWSSPFGVLLLNNIPLQKNSMIVDIGCGTGFPLLEVAQRCGDSCKVFGIDPWETAVNRANEKKIVQENYVMRFVDGSSFFNHYFIKLAFLQEWKEMITEENWSNVFQNLENRLNNIASINSELVFNVPIAYIECEK